MSNRGKAVICPKSLLDAANDYDWQSNSELAHLTATQTLTTPFSAYLLGYIGQLRRHSTSHQFAIKTRNGRHIGNCVCYGINRRKQEAELGIMIGDRNYWDKGYGSDTILWLADFAFNDLGLRRVHLKTLAENTRAQHCFLNCGFSPCGSAVIDGQSFLLMELRREWRQADKAEETAEKEAVYDAGG